MTTANELSPNESKTDSCQTPRSLATSEHSLIQDVASFTEELRMLSAGDSPANPGPSPGNVKASWTKEISGRTPLASLEQLGQGGYFWKTSQACFRALTGISDKFSETWPKRGVMLNGVCWELPMWAHLTGGKESGLWPTIHGQEPGWKNIEVVDKNDNPPTHWNQRFYDKKTGRLVQKGLTQVVQMWPTPTVQDGKNDGGPSQFKRNSLPLNAVAKWPTPNTIDYKTGKCETARRTDKLGEAVGPSKTRGALNPDWVEWLMGWPVGWSSLEPIERLLWLDWSVDPAEDGCLPRVTPQTKGRVSRLKAIGNGQVPPCMAAAWRLLTSHEPAKLP